MFNNDQKITLPVRLTLVGGERLDGVIVLPRVQKLFEVLNKPDLYIEFNTRDGRELVIAKSAIQTAAMLDERKAGAGSGSEALRRPTEYDPHVTLGLAKNAPEADIRPAYLKLVRLYHPDQFAAHPLPPEVSEYLESMFIQIQRAYDDLSGRNRSTRDAA